MNARPQPVNTASGAELASPFQNQHRAKALEDCWRAASSRVYAALLEARVVTQPEGFGYGVPDHLSGLERLRYEEWEAHWQLVRFWQRQAQQTQRLLNSALASDDMSDETRDTIVRGLGATRRDAKLLTNGEQELIALYRSLNVRTRTTVRTILGWAQRAASGDSR